MILTTEFHKVFTKEHGFIQFVSYSVLFSVLYGVRHGYLSRNLAKKFLISNNLNPSDYQDVLNAIEYHDNKEYDKKISGNRLLRLLSVADDLDAFGETGISRYTEIYLARGVSKDRLGYAILENAASRFANFELFAAGKPLLFEKHKKRYIVLKEHFENYNRLSGTYDFRTG